MLDEVRALLILQDRDRRLLALAKDLEKSPLDEARARTKLAGDEAAVSKAHDALLAAELNVKKIELDAQTRRTTINRLKIQQFETRKNEEYQAFSHEITRYEKEIDGLETQELEAMEVVDKRRAAHAAAQTALAITRKLVDEDLVALAERKSRMERELKEVSADRAALASDFSGTSLALYERLMRTKSGLAVAPMNEDKCGGCHMRVIASTAINAQAALQITQCENCGRILYVAE